MAHTYAIFSALYSPHVGGVESFTENLSNELESEGNHAIVVTSQLGNSPSYEENDNGVEVVRFPSRQLMSGRFPIPIHNSEFEDVVTFLRRQPIDRVLINTRFYPHTIEGLKLAQMLHAPCVLLDHGSAYLTVGNAGVDAIIRLYEQSITKRVKRYQPIFAGISVASVQWLSTFGIDTDLVIHNAVDGPQFRSLASGRDFRTEYGISGDYPLIAFVGRLAPEKGPDIVVEMARELEGEVEVVLAGDGAMRKRLQETASRNVHLAGNLTRPDLSALLLQADLFCLPSRSEGFCTSLLEASACGTPSVITDVGGARELIPTPEYGYIVSEMSAPSILEAVRQFFVLDASERERMGTRCLSLVDNEFGWKNTLRMLEKAFLQVTDDSGGARLMKKTVEASIE